MSNRKHPKKYPQSRLKWSDLSRSRGIDTKGMMTRFFARYAMAHGFRGVIFEGYSPSSVRGYGALLKLQLAYSAFDVFVKAVKSFENQLGTKKKEIYEYTLVNSELADKIRERHQLVAFLMKMCTSHSIVRRMHLFIGDVPSISSDEILKDKLQRIKSDFERSKDVEIVSGDILFIAASLRHGVAHGDMSLHSVGVESAAVVRLIDAMALKVLELCEVEFEKIIDAVELLPILPSNEVLLDANAALS